MYWIDYFIITLKWLEIYNLIKWSRIPHPLHRLPGSNQPDILHLCYSVKEQFKPFLVVGSCEPGTRKLTDATMGLIKWLPSRVIEESKRGPVGLEVSLEVLHDH